MLYGALQYVVVAVDTIETFWPGCIQRGQTNRCAWVSWLPELAPKEGVFFPDRILVTFKHGLHNQPRFSFPSVFAAAAATAASSTTSTTIVTAFVLLLLLLLLLRLLLLQLWLMLLFMLPL